MMSTKTLIYIAGPTGVGKTKTSIALAKAFDTEIISCDSRQFYQEMQIGTAVPSKEELAAVKHHFIQSKSVNENYTVADFETEALQTVERLFKEKDTLIMVGGSGMYADAVMFGMDKFPELPNEVRTILYEKINTRVDQMIQSGLEEEVRSLIPYKTNTALRTVGYKELFPYFDGDCTLDEAILEIKKNTRRYAKRQITWFKKYDNALCFPANTSVDEIYKLLQDDE